MRQLLISLALLATISGTSQVRVQIKNTSSTNIIVEVPLLGIKEAISANGMGASRQAPAIRTTEEVMIFTPSGSIHVNSNRALKDTAYTSGNFVLQLFYSPTTKKWYSRLKKI